MDRLAFSLPQLAKALGVSVVHVRHLIDQGIGPKTFIMGRRKIVLRSDAVEWLNRLRDEHQYVVRDDWEERADG